MTDADYRNELRKASLQVKYGLWRTLLLLFCALFLGVKWLLSGGSALLGLAVLTLLMSWQSWGLYQSGKRTFELVTYFGEKFSGGESAGDQN